MVEQLLYGALEEIYGFLGGTLFFGSWVLQAWQSKKRNRPVVTIQFFVMRAVGCAFLSVEAIRTGSVSLFLVMVGTLLLIFYNIWLLRRYPQAE